MTISPVARANPVRSAAPLPMLRSWCTTSIERFSWISRSLSRVPSVELVVHHENLEILDLTLRNRVDDRLDRKRLVVARDHHGERGQKRDLPSKAPNYSSL